MRFMDLFGRQRSANTAQHRLQVLLMHERCGGNPDLIPILREDILAAISKHVAVDPDKVGSGSTVARWSLCSRSILRYQPPSNITWGEAPPQFTTAELGQGTRNLGASRALFGRRLRSASQPPASAGFTNMCVHSRAAPYVGAFFLLRWLVQTDTHKATS